MKQSSRLAEQQLIGKIINYFIKTTALLRYCSIALFIYCFFFLSSANAFDVKGLQPLPPYGIFSTFSAESLKQNSVGFSLSIEKSVEPNFYRTFFNFAYAIHDRLEFNLTAPYVFEWQDKVDGFEDISMAIKHRLIDETAYSPAFAYIVSVSVPSGKDDFSTDGSTGIGAILTKKVGPFKGHLNVFYSHPGKSELKDEYTINVGTELAISHKSKILAEIVGKKDYFKNKINLFEWRLGYRIATTDNIFTTVGAGFDLKNRSPDYRLIFSVSYILLPKKNRIIESFEN